jgi:hypothetical protein
MLDAGVPPLLQEAIKRNLESGSGGDENEYAFLGIVFCDHRHVERQRWTKN